MSSEKEKCLVVIRIRGNVGIDKEREYAFQLMHLARKNHAVLVGATPSNLGSILKVKDYATWGEATSETISLLLAKRGALEGGGKVTEDFVKEELGYPSLEGLAKAMYHSEVKMNALPKVKPVFRLHPPRKGFRGKVKKPYPEGELGYRGEAINQLILRMM